MNALFPRLASGFLLFTAALFAPGCNEEEPTRPIDLGSFFDNAGPGGFCLSDGSCQAGLRCKGSECHLDGSFHASCASDLDCQSALRCSQGLCETRTLALLDEPCEHNSDCTSGLICNWSSTPFVCTPPVLVGDHCGHPTDCITGVCELGRCDCNACPGGEVCSARGCVPQGSVKDGERCRHNADCNQGLACIWAEEPYLCGAFRQKGEACGHPTDCAAGLSCDRAGACDTACSDDSACGEGQRCLSTKTCGQPGDFGERCGGPSDCGADLWCKPTIWGSMDGLCEKKLPLESACSPLGFEPCQGAASCVGGCQLKAEDPRFFCGMRLPAGAPCATCATTEEEISQCEGQPWLCDDGCDVGLACVDAVCTPKSP